MWYLPIVLVTLLAPSHLSVLFSCFITVIVAGDTTPPVISGCPQDITHVVSSGQTGTVYWIAPYTRDASHVRLLFQSHSPGDPFDEGVTTILYLYEDSSENNAECTFTVTIRRKWCFSSLINYLVTLAVTCICYNLLEKPNFGVFSTREV